MQIVLYNKHLNDKDLPAIRLLLELLARQGIKMLINKPLYDALASKGIDLGKETDIFNGYSDFLHKKIDFVITLGGDGTILDAVTHIRDTGVPILGINLGRLGFMANINKNRIEEAIEALVRGSFRIEQRSLLYLESSPALFGDTPFALNDFTLLKRDTSSMIAIHAYLNGDFLNTYWADGIIVATPTGSTGYSVSCGGPIVFPESNVFIITPVAPHNLNVRPLVVSDTSVLSFEVEGRAENFLCTLDSRFEAINHSYQIAVRRADFTVSIVQLFGENFLRTIRDKIGWGKDSRN